MNKLLLTVALVLLIIGCSNTENTTSRYKLPNELKDCSFYRMSDNIGIILDVVRCPNSNTSATYRSGKTNITTTVIED